jgi:hypothetical protein
VTRRQATQPELQTLTSTATALATLAFTWTPGLVTPVIAAVLTYLAAITAGSQALRWHTPHTLAATNLILRHTLATTIRATAWTVQALATATLLALNALHTRTLPTNHTLAA